MSGGPRLTRSGWRARVRCGAGAKPVFKLAVTDEIDAERLYARMVAVSRQLVRAGKTTEAPIVVRKLGLQATEKGRADIERLVAELVLDAGKPALAAAVPTVRAVAEAWLDGSLHTRFPDHVRPMTSAKSVRGRLELHVLPHIGDKLVSAVTLDDCLEVMRRLPERSSRSRVQIAGAISRILKLSVFPLRVLERSPLPAGFMPRPPKRKLMQYLYPAEDRALLADTRIALEWRMLWGVLAREGMRASEATGLTWGDLDLANGAVRLEVNKTDDARAWALDPGVHAALVWWRKERADESLDQLVFRRPGGARFVKCELARTFRHHLKRCGVGEARPELLTSTPDRQAIRVHDLRGTFVTLALAAGRSEAWICDRTGHQSSAMVARYKRASRSVSQLGLGELDPLPEAVPELRVGTNLGTEAPRAEKTLMKNEKIQTAPQRLAFPFQCGYLASPVDNTGVTQGSLEPASQCV